MRDELGAKGRGFGTVQEDTQIYTRELCCLGRRLVFLGWQRCQVVGAHVLHVSCLYDMFLHQMLFSILSNFGHYVFFLIMGLTL